MAAQNVPEVLWDYCLDWCSATRRHTAYNIHQLDGKTPHTLLTGDTGDISHLAEFGFYDWVWFIDEQGHRGLDGHEQRSVNRKRLGRHLGPSRNYGGAMSGVDQSPSSLYGTHSHRCL